MARTPHGGPTKKEQLAADIAAAVGAGRVVAVETVDFADPNRPKTCLEVDFPILPINQIAAIEGNAGKPIYQMSKWWARRRSSVFRSLLIAAGMKAPDDHTQAAKAVWDVYYANHQEKGALSHLKVADIFMGGGTTLVEGSRLGMQLWGTDLNPVAWLVVKNELAKVDAAEVQDLLEAIETDVKPQVIPFYAIDCPRGHKGTWTRRTDSEQMGPDFQPLALTPEERPAYSYEGPESIYVFWAKHGPCQVTGCGHRTPIMSSPVVAIKTITVKAIVDHECPTCKGLFDVEHDHPRMAPGVPLAVAASEKPFAVIDQKLGVTCPFCGYRENVKLGKEKKKVDLTLLVHPDWLAGAPRNGPDGVPYGGSCTDTPAATAVWNRARASWLRLLEVRGVLPDLITCPETHVTFRTDKGTVPKKSTFTCQAPTCGREQDVLQAIKASGTSGPVAAYAVQGYCPTCDREGRPYGGRFFIPATDTVAFDAANSEWNARRTADLEPYWPKSDLPFGFMTSMNNGGLPNHGYTHWWKFFNPRQLLVHSQLLKAIAATAPDSFPWEIREYVLGAFQQYLRNQNMFSLWNLQADKLEPLMSSNNYHPKATVAENSVFGPLGRGNWLSCTEALPETLAWSNTPWEVVSVRGSGPAGETPETATTRSERVGCNDPVGHNVKLECSSASELTQISSGSFDLVVTDPPFGGLLHYSELADFFYVWLRLVLKDRYPDYFAAEYTPKALEVVANRARHPEDPDAFYQRLLTECWREANRILKPGGILAFTFHHSEDEPWVAVLESLFDAGFYLEATYPIRSDETKGEGSKPGTFGSQKIEYDIIHVCRKRLDEPTPVSWGRMRREVLQDVRRLKSLLEHHAKDGLPAADLQVVKRGKALEYYSRHYGKVYVDETREVTVRDALLGINQLLDEESGQVLEPPPIIAEPLTRQLLRIFETGPEVPRDQLQKYLRGTGIAPNELEDRGWCREDKKVFRLVTPLEIARSWQGKPRKNMRADYDQAMYLIGASIEGSGINIRETLKNDNFQPHPALGALLEWHARRGTTPETRTGAARATAILRGWQDEHREKAQQLDLFFGDAA
jgi:putative DNA methylase